MGEVLPFPRKPEPAEPEPAGLTEDELARYVAMLAGGYTKDHAAEVLAQSRRIRGVCHGD